MFSLNKITTHRNAEREINCLFRGEELEKEFPEAVSFQDTEFNAILRHIDYGILHLKGKALVRGVFPCARCLSDVKFESKLEPEAYFVPEQNFDIWEEMALSDDALDCEIYSGNKINLFEVLTKAFFQSLPSVILCGDDCRGLCPYCGKDLNTGDCGCEADHKKDNAGSFGVLKNLL